MTKTTPLHAAHLALGAKMGPFAGYAMPLYYADGVLREHEHTRTHAGLFDVSHMGQVLVRGAKAGAFLERLCPGALAGMPDGRARYSVLTNAQGGILDDLIITRLGMERFFVVVNAGRKDADFAWMRESLADNAIMETQETRALLALQGPEAEQALRAVLGFDAADMPYMWAAEWQGLIISRLGYTGEDGFEISVPAGQAATMWVDFLAHESVRPVGLAARDSLRLEMGYPLYGHDIDETTTPVEAGLSWIIGKNRAGYWGENVIAAQLQNGISRKRVGVRLLGKGIAREGAELQDVQGHKIGILTSGGFSPTLKSAIGQGYVDSAHAAAGTEILVNVRGNTIAAEIAPMPFVPAKTRSMKAKAA